MRKSIVGTGLEEGLEDGERFLEVVVYDVNEVVVVHEIRDQLAGG
jgi:hypothetical protein